MERTKIGKRLKPEEVSKLLFDSLNCLEKAKVEIEKQIEVVAKAYGESLGPTRKGQHVEKFTPKIQILGIESSGG